MRKMASQGAHHAAKKESFVCARYQAGLDGVAMRRGIQGLQEWRVRGAAEGQHLLVPRR